MDTSSLLELSLLALASCSTRWSPKRPAARQRQREHPTSRQQVFPSPAQNFEPHR